MPKPTPEQMKEFAEYEITHKGESIKPETIAGIIDDDVAEHEINFEKRLNNDRTYNHLPGEVQKRLVAEKEE